MECVQKKAIHDHLKVYDYLAKDNDFIEITEWTNGEGIDITINETKSISISYGELDAINYLVNTLRYKYEKV